MTEQVCIAECIKNKTMSLAVMALYKCHKEVHAIPMTLGTYNFVRGWKMPEIENPEDEGYLVVYNRGNEDEHVSWSPKHVFDDGYTSLMDSAEKPELDHVGRMKLEHSELFDKAFKLNEFIKENPIFKSLDEDEQGRLVAQVCLMTDYLNVLEARIIAAK